MPVEARLSILKPDSLTIVAQELRPKLKQSTRCHFLRYQRNLLQLKVLVGCARCIEKRSHRAWDFRIGKCRMQKQITPIFEVAEIHAQRTAIGDCRSDELLFVRFIGHPSLTRPSKTYATIQLAKTLEFNVCCQLFGC